MAKTEKATIAYSFNDIPEGVRKNLQGIISAAQFGMAARTEYRPNSDMPFAWIVLRAQQVVLCSTHKTRGIYARHPFGEVNDVRLEQGRVLRLLFNDPANADLVIPLQRGLPADQITVLFQTLDLHKRQSKAGS